MLSKYHTNTQFRLENIARSKINMLSKYHTNTQFRLESIVRSKVNMLSKYHTNTKFRLESIARSKINMLSKYHINTQFRNEYKANTKQRDMKKYYSDDTFRLKMTAKALGSYHSNCTPEKQNQRRLYDQSRRIMKKYVIIQSHSCQVKHRTLYINNLQSFRKLNREGPDCICIVCRLSLFRNQVIPYIQEKYIKENMSYELKGRLKSYLKDACLTGERWICKSCSDKIKKHQMPSRAIKNKLEVSDIPPELKNLNNLEKHLIALRLPFMKIVNLTSGKLSSRLSQKGTKGPLHCVPSDVQDTVTTLPRPIDKSMMVRLQLKRRIQYKAVWEEQLINPFDVRDALVALIKTHPGYKDIEISEIDENLSYF